MRKSRFRAEQIVAIMMESEAPDVTVAQVAKKHGITETTLFCWLLSDVSAMKAKLSDEIDLMKSTPLSTERAHHLMMVAVRQNALPASKLPKVVEQFDGLDNPEFEPGSAWALFNAFTYVIGGQQPWQQMDNTLRPSSVFRDQLVPS